MCVVRNSLEVSSETRREFKTPWTEVCLNNPKCCLRFKIVSYENVFPLDSYLKFPLCFFWEFWQRPVFFSLPDSTQGHISVTCLVILMLHFSWTWVGLVFTDDHKGAYILSDLRTDMDRNKVCVALVEILQASWFPLPTMLTCKSWNHLQMWLYFWWSWIIIWYTYKYSKSLIELESLSHDITIGCKCCF